jgi:acyl carrier protein
VLGELYIGGDCLARGYLERADLTAERFIPNPFSKIPGARLYRTGDNARYLPNGNIEYLGRSDQQVKLRGFRVELGEIEAVLAEHPFVREAVVVVEEVARGDQRLVAYIVPRDSSQLSLRQLPAYLRQRLPEYMIPSVFVPRVEIHRTASGKVDRNSLPVANSSSRVADREFVQPRTPIEEIVAGIFSQTLNVERVGAEDNFFEMGGHSLLAMQVISRLREMFRVELPLRSLFEAPTVAQLSAQILAREGTTGQTERIARVIKRLHEADSHPAT